MADSYPHALLVEFEPNAVPKLKNKLTKYFQSKKLSGGGDCTVEHHEGSRSAVLRFRAQSDQRNVLEKESHLLSLKTGHLKVTVRLLSEPQESPADKSDSKPAAPQRPSVVHTRSRSPGPDDGSLSSLGSSLSSFRSDAPLSPASDPGSLPPGPSLPSASDPAPPQGPLPMASVVGNLAPDVMQDFLEMLVENIMKRPVSEDITVEMIPALKSAVISFKTSSENAEFVQRCPGNGRFKSKGLTVRPLDPPTQLLMEESGLDEEYISLFFEKNGAVMEKAEVNVEKQNTVISFSSAADVQMLLQKRLVLRKKELKLYPFYPSLGRALYGSDRPPLKLPAAVVHHADPALLQFFSNRASVLQTLHTRLKALWCQAELLQDGVKLSPEPELLQQETLLAEWTGSVRSALSEFLSDFEVWKLNPPPDLWKNSLEKVSALLKSETQVLMVPSESDGVIKVVGPKVHISKLQEPLCESINSLIKRARREKALVTEQIKVPMRVFNLLSQDGLQQNLLNVYPEIKFDTSGPFLKVTGLTEEIVKVHNVIYEKSLALRRQQVEVDPYLLEFLKGEEQEEQTNAVLSQKNAVFEVSGNKIQLQACTDADLSDAEAHLRLFFVSQYVKAEDRQVLETIEWKQLLDQTEKEENQGGKKVQIRTEGDQVVVSGFKNKVESVSSKLEEYLKQNADITKNVAVKPIVKLEYLQQIGKSKLDELFEDKKVVISFTKDALSLSGSRVNVTDRAKLLEDLINSVAFETLTVVKHGARKLFEDKDENYQATLATKTGCWVKIVDTTDAKQAVPSASHLPKPVYEIQTPDGVKIFVSNADMCSYPVHAIVNATVEDLQLKSGLAAALVKAAGHQLQAACDKIIQQKGSLKAGDCEVTDAGGSLVCRKIIHAVGPQYDQTNIPKSQALLKRAVKRSLDLAEQHHCESLAIPAISRHRKFPLKECAQTIVKAVREYCEDRFGECFLKSVHLVNNDDVAVTAMENAVKREFGDRGVSHKKATPAPTLLAAMSASSASSVSASSASSVSTSFASSVSTSSASSVSTSSASSVSTSFASSVSTSSASSVSTSSASSVPAPAPLDPNCVGRELTNEGLEICILKGKLEKSTTDVIVNTVTQDLVLNRGAVSNAILSAAGPSLQTLVLAQQSQGTVGDVIVTAGEGLRCQQVYHAVAPHYDNGQGTAQKQLSGIFRDCLSKAESSGMTSISFSAIGTGNLGFPRDLVWTLLMDNVLEISRKKPKSLQKVQVVLFPGDTQTIQVFSDEFQKKFPKAGGSSTTAATAAAAAPSGGLFSKVVSSSSSHETKMGGVTVQVVTGDITKETTDVIVNSSNEKFSLKSGVSKAILEAAGPAVESECHTLGAQPNNGMILTQPGNLRCKKILHLVGQTDLTKLHASVRDALQLCIKDGLCSVAFPAIGTGQGGVSARGVADGMFDAVIEVLNKNPGSSLKTVKVVIFQNQMLKDFHDSMQQRVSSDPKGKDKAKESGMLGALAEKIKSLFGQTSPQTTQTSSDFVIEPLKPTPLCFHICGESAQKIDLAKKKINSILTKRLQSHCIKDENVLSLTSKDHQELKVIQQRVGVGIRVECTNGEGVITVEGLAADMVTVTSQIHEMLKVARQEEDLNEKATLLSAVVEWQYSQPGQDFQSFDARTSYELEQGLERKLKEVKVKLNGQEYSVKLPQGPATSRSGAALDIQRVKKMGDLPSTWAPMDTSATKVFTLKAGSQEYTTVEQLFKASCNRNITKIERVQNPVLWQGLQIKRKAMDQKNGHSNNERRLFHGTSQDTVAVINERGFNRSYAGKNAAAYGNGTYFAVNAQYSSSNTYSRPSANGDKFMYLCSVLTGDFTAGAGGMIEPPRKNNSSIERYDSVVDNATRPSMFIIFHDSHAYPEYLITFK